MKCNIEVQLTKLGRPTRQDQLFALHDLSRRRRGRLDFGGRILI